MRTWNRRWPGFSRSVFGRAFLKLVKPSVVLACRIGNLAQRETVPLLDMVSLSVLATCRELLEVCVWKPDIVGKAIPCTRRHRKNRPTFRRSDINEAVLTFAHLNIAISKTNFQVQVHMVLLQVVQLLQKLVILVRTLTGYVK